MLSVFKLTKSSHLDGLSYVVPYTRRPRPLQRSGNWAIYLFGTIPIRITALTTRSWYRVLSYRKTSADLFYTLFVHVSYVVALSGVRSIKYPLNYGGCDR
jgi:hypothetical protein